MKLDLIVGLIVYGVLAAFAFWSVYWVLKSDLDTSKPWLVFFIVVVFLSLKVDFTNGGESVMRLNYSKEEKKE